MHDFLFELAKAHWTYIQKQNKRKSLRVKKREEEEKCVCVCERSCLGEVWIPLTPPHLLPANHFCHVAVKDFTSNEYTGGH